MKIRKATTKDIKGIAGLLHEYDLYEHKLDKSHKVDKMSEIISFNRKLMKSSIVVYFVLENDGKVEGIISGELRTTALGKGAIFHNIFISKEFRGKGYGEKLLMTLENYFKKKGCKSIKSFVLSGNEKVLNFYKKIGYSSEKGWTISKRLK